MRHIDLRGQPRRHGLARLALPVIAAGRGADAFGLRIGPFHPIDEGDGTSRFERSGRRVVLMLDPHLRPGLCGELRPGILRRRLHLCVNQLRRRF